MIGYRWFIQPRIGLPLASVVVHHKMFSVNSPSVPLKLIYTVTLDKTRPSRLPVDRRRRDAGQAGRLA